MKGKEEGMQNEMKDKIKEKIYYGINSQTEYLS